MKISLFLHLKSLVKFKNSSAPTAVKFSHSKFRDIFRNFFFAGAGKYRNAMKKNSLYPPAALIVISLKYSPMMLHARAARKRMNNDVSNYRRPQGAHKRGPSINTAVRAHVRESEISRLINLESRPSVIHREFTH